MYENDIRTLQDKKEREALYDLNQVIKNVFKFYTYIDGVICPSEMDAIMNQSLFLNSIFIHKRKYDFMNECMISPTELSKGLKRKPSQITLREEERIIWNDKEEKFVYGASMDTSQVIDANKYRGIMLLNDLNLEEYPIVYHMDDNTVEELKSYAMINLILGEDDKGLVSLLAGLKLFPCIKKATDITIYGKRDGTLRNKNTFQIVIVESSDDWSFYAFHYMINLGYTRTQYE